jgi:hypothetical protein
MEKVFRELSRYYKDYFKLKDNLSAEYDKAQKSGNYSKSYLGRMSGEHLEHLKNERSVIAGKMNKKREEFLKDLNYKYSLERYLETSIFNLQKLLNSGIEFNDREFLELAERHKNNITESRIIHDYAKNKGYNLSNYIPYEDVVLNFDNYCKQIQSSLSATDGFTMPYPTLEECENAGGRYYAMSVKPKMEIEPIPEKLEDAISLEFAKQLKEQEKISEEQEKAFLIGLSGTEEEKENFLKSINTKDKTEEELLKDKNKTEEELLKDKIALLTAEEKADAKYISKFKGHKGKITEEEIAYIESEDYKKAVEEREQEQKQKTQ